MSATSPKRQRGLSLVELIVFIVIVSAAVAGIIGVIDVTTRSSADPMIHKQALAIAEAVLEEVQLQPFTYCDPDDPAAATVDMSGGGSIAFDGASQGTTGSTAVGSLTFSHTVGAGGASRILVVGVSLFSTAAPLPTVSSITYAGQSMTFLAGVNDGGAVPVRIRTEMWYIIAPATGANNIAITFSSAVRAVAGGMSYTGVHQASPFGTPATAGGDSTSASVAVSSAAGELVVDAVGARENTSETQSLTAGAGQTQRFNGVSRTGTGSNSNVVGAGSEEAGAASVTMSWTVGTSARWAIVAAPLKPGGSCPNLTEAIGPEAGETRYSSTLPFDNVNDYHGFDSNTAVPSGIRNIDSTLIAGLDGYRVTVSVAGQALGGIGDDAAGYPQSLLITVTVTGPGNTTVTLNGYRARYAPNDLP